MVADRELEAERLKDILVGFDTSIDPRMPNIVGEVQRIVRDQRLDVQPDTPEWAVLSRAVREGLIKGQREIDAMLSGAASAVPEERLKPKDSAAPRLSEAVSATAALGASSKVAAINQKGRLQTRAPGTKDPRRIATTGVKDCRLPTRRQISRVLAI